MINDSAAIDAASDVTAKKSIFRQLSFYVKIVIPLLIVVCTMITNCFQQQNQREIASLHNDTQREIASLHNNTQIRFGEIKALVDTSQLKISRGQIVVNLIDNIIKGTKQEKEIALKILYSTDNQKIAQEIINILATSDNQENRDQALTVMRTVGSGAQALATIKDMQKAGKTENEKKEARDAEKIIMQRTLTIANVFYEQQNWPEAAQYYNDVASNINKNKKDSNALLIAKTYYDQGAYEMAARNYHDIFKRMKDQ